MPAPPVADPASGAFPAAEPRSDDSQARSRKWRAGYVLRTDVRLPPRHESQGRHCLLVPAASLAGRPNTEMKTKLASTGPRVLLICEDGAGARRPPNGRCRSWRPRTKAATPPREVAFDLAVWPLLQSRAVHIGAPMQRSARRVACCYGERRRSGFIRRPVVVLRECIEA